MSDSDVVQNIVTIEIELEEEENDGPLVIQTVSDEERELTENTITENQLTEQVDSEKKQEDRKEEETKGTIKQEKADEPEEREKAESCSSRRLLARRQYIYRQQQRDTDAAPSTREKAEDKTDGYDKPKEKAGNETGEGGRGERESRESESGQGTSGEGTSDDEPSGEKKAKIEEPSIDEDDDSNNNSSNGLGVLGADDLHTPYKPLLRSALWQNLAIRVNM